MFSYVLNNYTSTLPRSFLSGLFILRENLIKPCPIYDKNRLYVKILLFGLAIVIRSSKIIFLKRFICHDCVNLTSSVVSKASGWKTRGRWFDFQWRHVFSFWFFRFLAAIIWKSYFSLVYSYVPFSFKLARGISLSWLQKLSTVSMVLYWYWVFFVVWAKITNNIGFQIFIIIIFLKSLLEYKIQRNKNNSIIYNRRNERIPRAFINNSVSLLYWALT